MSKISQEAADAVGKLLAVIVFAFVIRPLAIIYGVNLLLSAIGMTVLPYTLLVYFGVLLIIMAFKVEFKAAE